MKLNRLTAGPLLMVIGGVLLSIASTGCQSTVGGQTLPSAFYLRDDIQYFPAGPEFKLSKQVEAMEEYNLRQQEAADVQNGL